MDDQLRADAGVLLQAAEVLRPGPWEARGHELYEGPGPGPGVRHWQVPTETVAAFLAECRNRAERLASGYIEAADRNRRLREALSWAVGFIRCHHPRAATEYPDMRNAADLVDAAPLYSGEFHTTGVRAEVAEDDRDRFRAALERIAGMPFSGVDAAADMAAVAAHALDPAGVRSGRPSSLPGS